MNAISTATLAILAIASLIAMAVWSSGAAHGRGADIVRQWVVCQYVNAGENPWALSKDILISKFGAGNPERITVNFIPREIPAHRAGDIIPELGPPEATYPPSAVGLLAPTIGQLPTPAAALWTWFAVNVAALGLVAVSLSRLWPVPPGGGTKFDNVRLVPAILLVFPATYSTFACGQFSLLVLGLLLVANDPSRSSLTRGLALGVALIKPSIALPFVFLPLVNRQWRVLIAAATVQAMATVYIMAQTGSLAVVDMVRDWMAVSGFFLNGIYTLQEWLSALTPIFPRLNQTAASLGVLGLSGITLFAARRLPSTQQFTIAAVTSIFWTYHRSYDFLMLLPVLMPYVGWSDQRSGERRWAIGPALLMVILALALAPAVFYSDTTITRIIRWMARITVIGLFVQEYLRVFWRGARHGNTEHDGSKDPAELAASQPVVSPSS